MATLEHGDWVGSVGYLSGNRMYSAGEDGIIRLWNPDHSVAAELGVDMFACAGSVSADVVLGHNGNDGEAVLWNIETGATARLPGHPTAVDPDEVGANITCAAVSADGAHAATGGFDSCVRLWDLAIQKLRWECQLERLPSSLAFSPKGGQLAIGTAGLGVQVLSSFTGESVAEKKPIKKKKNINGLGFLSEETLVTAGANGKLARLQISAGKLASAGSYASQRGGVQCLAVSHDGTFLLAAPRTGCVQHHTDDGEERTVSQELAPILDLAVSPDNRTFAVATVGPALLLPVSGNM